jgi:hypothetical protein
LLTLRSLQICQGSGVGSIPIGRSILFAQLRRRFIFHVFQFNWICLRASVADFVMPVVARNPTRKLFHCAQRSE